MEWIKVEDKLPDEKTWVLCIDNQKVMYTARHYKIKKARDPGYINVFESGLCCGREPGKPTHWMPLPQPPKEI